MGLGANHAGDFKANGNNFLNFYFLIDFRGRGEGGRQKSFDLFPSEEACDPRGGHGF